MFVVVRVPPRRYSYHRSMPKGQYIRAPGGRQTPYDLHGTQRNSPKAYFSGRMGVNFATQPLKASFASANHPKLPHPTGGCSSDRRALGLALPTYHRHMQKLGVYREVF